jgi:alanine dehydrogenase
MALSNIFAPMALRIASSGSVRHIASEDSGFRNGVYLYNGILVNRLIGNHFDLPSNDIGLLIAGF